MGKKATPQESQLNAMKSWVETISVPIRCIFFFEEGTSPILRARKPT